MLRIVYDDNYSSNDMYTAICLAKLRLSSVLKDNENIVPGQGFSMSRFKNVKR